MAKERATYPAPTLISNILPATLTLRPRSGVVVTKTIRKVPNPESDYKRISHKISRQSYSSLNLVDDNRTMSLKSSNRNAAPKPTIPQFYFPQGNTITANSKKRTSIMIDKLQSTFNNFVNKNQAGKSDWKALAKAAQCPFYSA